MTSSSSRDVDAVVSEDEDMDESEVKQVRAMVSVADAPLCTSYSIEQKEAKFKFDMSLFSSYLPHGHAVNQ